MRSVLILCFLWFSVPSECADKDNEWYRSSIIYQVFPASFKDSNNDGIGDFKGLTEKLGYIKDLGANVLWLSSFSKALYPDLDFAITDYRTINPIFGTMTDFEDLIAECKKLGIRVIMDFVPNHTSVEHDWFKNSVAKVEPFTDYYVWKANDGNATHKKPPNNWRTIEGEEAWTWNEQRGEYYYHAFKSNTADLNYQNDKIHKEMEDLLAFWMSHGIDGFVIETISWLVEDNKFNDEDLEDQKKPSSVNHKYTRNHKGSVYFVVSWRKFIDEFGAKDSKSRFLMVKSDPFDEINTDYYNILNANGAHTIINPAFININSFDINVVNIDLKIGSCLRLVHNTPDRHMNWVTGGSVYSRVSNRVGQEMIDIANMLILMLPGIAITYYGEEIGMSNFYQRWSPYEERDRYYFARTPFQWNDHPNAGFTTTYANIPWLPVNPDYYRINVQVQSTDPKSHINVYKRTANLRKNEDFVNSDISTFIVNDNVFSVVRETKEHKRYILIANLETSSTCVDFKHKLMETTDLYLTVYAASKNSEYNIDDHVNLENCFLMRPRSSIIVTSSGETIVACLYSIIFLVYTTFHFT